MVHLCTTFIVKNIYRKIIAASFLLLGCMPLLFLLFSALKKIEIKEMMKEKLETDKLQTIVLPEEKVVWMDKHEIWVNEHMFDIHSKKLENGIYTFTGLYDDDETELVKKERRSTEDHSAQNKILAKIFKQLPAVNDIAAEDLTPNTSDHFFNFFVLQQTINQYKEIITPPPQV